MRLRKRILLTPFVIRLMRWLNLTVYYGQNREDKIVAAHFRNMGGVGNLLSIGENDGRTYSNVLYFLLRGWKGDLVEPGGIAFNRMAKLHEGNDRVRCHNIAIGTAMSRDEIFWESGECENLGESGIVSTFSQKLKDARPQLKWKASVARVMDFSRFLSLYSSCRTYQLISIDAEGMDWDIIQQIDFEKLGCRCLIMEHGNNGSMFQTYISHMNSFGFFLRCKTPENFIFVK